ncbi:MAG: sugar phosphate isomerase/epimerase, partial [Lentisphaeria bacterium]|nr:sugar phosphate isomerase/epimerase [Lentisphaeria bacterium]
FHHMMVGTCPRHVALCLDAHWIFRGAGNSMVAVRDVVRLYGQRVVELHLRQSVGGVWQEVFGPGDIDYAWIRRHLQDLGVQPHLVLEQAVERASPQTRNAAAAHRESCAFARELFAATA